jgi:hypothetical protein
VQEPYRNHQIPVRSSSGSDGTRTLYNTALWSKMNPHFRDVHTTCRSETLKPVPGLTMCLGHSQIPLTRNTSALPLYRFYPCSHAETAQSLFVATFSRVGSRLRLLFKRLSGVENGYARLTASALQFLRVFCGRCHHLRRFVVHTPWQGLIKGA